MPAVLGGGHRRQRLPVFAEIEEDFLARRALLPIPDPAHPDLTFVRVTTDEQLRAYADLNSRAYRSPLEDGRDKLVGSTLRTN